MCLVRYCVCAGNSTAPRTRGTDPTVWRVRLWCLPETQEDWDSDPWSKQGRSECVVSWTHHPVQICWNKSVLSMRKKNPSNLYIKWNSCHCHSDALVVCQLFKCSWVDKNACGRLFFLWLLYLCTDSVECFLGSRVWGMTWKQPWTRLTSSIWMRLLEEQSQENRTHSTTWKCSKKTQLLKNWRYIA